MSFNMKKIRTIHVGVGGMGLSDLKDISSHKSVEVVGLCDVDSIALEEAAKYFPQAKKFSDYRIMIDKLKDFFDAVVISTPDHMHGPIAIKAMENKKHVYCQKPLSNNISDCREMNKLAKEKKLVTQMGIQVHSFHDYKLATLLIKDGIIGKVDKVRAWSPKNWGYNGKKHKASDSIPKNLDWNLWLGDKKYRDYCDGVYHPMMWRKMKDFGCGTLGDMGVHIFDTPYNALDLDSPVSVKNKCRKPNNYSFPEKNYVEYEFNKTEFTSEKLIWIWEDGKGSPKINKELKLPNNEKLPLQGVMFFGKEGKLLLPHFMESPKLIVENAYKDYDISKYIESGEIKKNPKKNYEEQSFYHYHEFIDSCLGKSECSAPFSYASKLTETILLGVIAGNFPGKKLNWDRKNGVFFEKEANYFLKKFKREY